MPTRRFVPNRFSRLLLLGAAAFLCTELTRKCSKVAPGLLAPDGNSHPAQLGAAALFCRQCSFVSL